MSKVGGYSVGLTNNFFSEYFTFSLKNIILYSITLSLHFHDLPSLFGFFTLLVIFNQIISGIMLSFSLVPESMMIPMVRDEEDLEDLYIDDFFWLHERGVDLIFIFSYCHIFRKLYLNSIEYEHELAWKSGVFTFLIFQVVVFLGLVLCCTHLSEITLTIAANIYHTFFFFIGKPYWWFFTDQQLNTDTIIRLAYLHYISAFYMLYLGILHSIDMHYDWKTESVYDGVDIELLWWDEGFSSELSCAIDIITITAIIVWYLYPEIEALSYELFTWGDVGLITDVRYYSVAPHWYFRPFMAWLIASPNHQLGVFGLCFFFWVLSQQPTLHGISNYIKYTQRKPLFFTFRRVKQANMSSHRTLYGTDLNPVYRLSYAFFMMAILYTTTFLPYGRFYNRVDGNIGFLFACLIILLWLTLSFWRRPLFWSLKIKDFTWLCNKISFLHFNQNFGLSSEIENNQIDSNIQKYWYKKILAKLRFIPTGTKRHKNYYNELYGQYHYRRIRIWPE